MDILEELDCNKESFDTINCENTDKGIIDDLDIKDIRYSVQWYANKVESFKDLYVKWNFAFSLRIKNANDRNNLLAINQLELKVTDMTNILPVQ